MQLSLATHKSPDHPGFLGWQSWLSFVPKNLFIKQTVQIFIPTNVKQENFENPRPQQTLRRKTVQIFVPYDGWRE